MSGIFDQIINYSPPLIVSGTVNYKGTWNASTNNPTLNDPPATSTKGDYYVVSTAGTQFTISFAVGDWIISSGTAWEKVDLTDAVSSVFGRTGAVVGVSTDYSSVGLTNTAIGASSPSTGAFTTVTASSTIAATGAVTGSNLSGTNTGDQTTITGNAGSATVLQTPRAIYGNNFDGSAALTQVIASTYGGTGNGFAKFSGPASSEKTFTLPNASSTLLYDGGALGTPASGTATNLTGTSGITGTGVLNSGSITSGFGSIDVGADSISGGAGAFTTLSASGAVTIGGTAQLTGSAPKLEIYHGTAVKHNISGTDVLSVSATGAAVTGALSASGKVTSTNGGVGFEVNYGGTGAGFSIVRTGASASTFTMLNSGGEIIHEYNSVGYGFNISTARVASISSTGLAVTGALSSTTGANFATSSGNVGIGTTSPAKKLHVMGDLLLDNVSTSTIYFSSDYYKYITIAPSTGDYLAFAGNPYASGIQFGKSTYGAASTFVPLMTITTGGNVGIGTSSPADTSNFGRALDIQSSTGAAAYFRDSDNTAKYAVAGFFGADSNAYYGSYGTSTGVLFYSSGSERARIDSSGNLLVGVTATSAYMDGALDVQASGGNPAICAKLNPSSSTVTQFVYSAWAPFTSGDNVFMQFETETSATVRGAISYNRGAGLVVYGTTSDYRSKDILGPVVDSGALIDSVPVYMGKMKGATQERPMFIAHETPAYAHTGEKDAVDAEGKPIYQQIDTSALLPVLWAELQSLRQRVAALENS